MATAGVLPITKKEQTMATTFENAVKSSAVLIYSSAWKRIRRLPEEEQKLVLIKFIESCWDDELYNITGNGFVGNPKDNGDLLEKEGGEQGCYLRFAYDELLHAFKNGRKSYTHNNKELRCFLDLYYRGKKSEARKFAAKHLGRTGIASNVEDNHDNNTDSNGNIDDNDKKTTGRSILESRLPTEAAIKENRSLRVARDDEDVGIRGEEEQKFYTEEWFPFVLTAFGVEGLKQLGEKTVSELDLIFIGMHGKEIEDWKKYTMKAILDRHEQGQFAKGDKPHAFPFQ